MRDHGGDWDGLDAAITQIGRSDGEAKWSHLLDLRQRLAAAGLNAGELVAETIGKKGLITRGRTRVFKQTVSWRDMTPAMRNPSSLRLEQRARYGWWPGVPSSPREPHDRLTGRADDPRVLAVHAIVAASALDRFETTARQLGSASWIACEAMVQAALAHGRVDVAQQTLDAADVPGRHQEWMRKRRAELAGQS